MRKFLAVALLPMVVFAQPASPPAFEVASVRLSSGPRTRGSSYFRYTPQGFEAASFDLHTLMGEVYQIPVARIFVPDSKVHVILDSTYDLIAKAEQPAPKEQLRLMLQTLLVERFKLSLRREFRQQDVYRLVVGKRRPKLPEPVTDGEDPRMTYLFGGLSFHNVTMAEFCGYLSPQMDRPVLDSTAIRGAYSFDLKIDGMPQKKGPVKSDLSTSSIFTDLQQQIGLQLVAGKAPLEYIIVDHAEQPSGN